MPSINIRRDQTGGDVQPLNPGETSRVQIAHVSYPDALDGFVTDTGHANWIWATAFGHAALHQSSRLHNPPHGCAGYFHSHDNTLFAVKRLDTAGGTVELVAGAGSVSGGVHGW